MTSQQGSSEILDAEQTDIDTFSEVDEAEVAGNLDTLLDEPEVDTSSILTLTLMLNHFHFLQYFVDKDV